MRLDTENCQLICAWDTTRGFSAFEDIVYHSRAFVNAGKLDACRSVAALVFLVKVEEDPLILPENLHDYNTT